MALQEKPRVLVVCKEGEEQQEFATYLQDLPYVATFSSDLRTSVSWADKDCSVVLLSSNLADKGCYQVLAERKASSTPMTIPVIIVAPNSAQGEVGKLLQLGADDFLLTPT